MAGGLNGFWIDAGSEQITEMTRRIDPNQPTAAK
jgi:hypothetical protein